MVSTAIANKTRCTCEYIADECADIPFELYCNTREASWHPAGGAVMLVGSRLFAAIYTTVEGISANC